MSVSDASRVPHTDPATVGQLRKNILFLLGHEPDATDINGWRRQRLAELEPYGDDVRLATLADVAYGGPWPFSLSEVERLAILWQHRNNVSLGGYRQALWEAIGLADEYALERLSLAYPDEVEAVRRWRNDREFVARIRALPTAFSV